MDICYLFFLCGVFFLKGTMVLSAAIFNEKGFKQDWCRQRNAMFDWKTILAPCQLDMEYNNITRSKFLPERTSAQKSLVTNMRIGSAGQFSHIWIESRDSLGNAKTYGGDSWRVMVRSGRLQERSVAADIFDYNNGSYEALVLLMEPGYYELDINLDYTLCDGFRNPPVEWFHKVHCSGILPNQRDIGTELFADMDDYINTRIGDGAPLKLTVPVSNIDFYKLRQLMVQADNDCNIQCEKLWDGYGRWHNSVKWTPYLQEVNLPSSADVTSNLFDGRLHLDYISNHARENGIFWIYGDSLSFYFYESFSKRHSFCKTIFKICNVSYNWIYPKTLYELKETCAETKLEVPRILYYVREVTNNPNMDEQSALIFNAGAHYVKTASFKQYKEAIEEIAAVLKKEYKGKAIWKSTSAIHDQTATVMGSFRRYTTDQRIKLFNAYSNSVMCQAGITFLDIYPISASYPLGTKDGIHYTEEVFMPVEQLLVNYFSHRTLPTDDPAPSLNMTTEGVYGSL